MTTQEQVEKRYITVGTLRSGTHQGLMQKTMGNRELQLIMPLPEEFPVVFCLGMKSTYYRDTPLSTGRDWRIVCGSDPALNAMPTIQSIVPQYKGEVQNYWQQCNRGASGCYVTLERTELPPEAYHILYPQLSASPGLLLHASGIVTYNDMEKDKMYFVFVNVHKDERAMAAYQDQWHEPLQLKDYWSGPMDFLLI